MCNKNKKTELPYKLYCAQKGQQETFLLTESSVYPPQQFIYKYVIYV